MRRLRWWPESRADLEEIWSCISTDDPRAADRVLAKLTEAAELLRNFPLMGVALPEFDSVMRIRTVDRYRLHYRAHRDFVEIIAVVHTSRLASPILRVRLDD